MIFTSGSCYYRLFNNKGFAFIDHNTWGSERIIAFHIGDIIEMKLIDRDMLYWRGL